MMSYCCALYFWHLFRIALFPCLRLFWVLPPLVRGSQGRVSFYVQIVKPSETNCYLWFWAIQIKPDELIHWLIDPEWSLTRACYRLFIQTTEESVKLLKKKKGFIIFIYFIFCCCLVTHLQRNKLFPWVPPWKHWWRFHKISSKWSYKNSFNGIHALLLYDIYDMADKF